MSPDAPLAARCSAGPVDQGRLMLRFKSKRSSHLTCGCAPAGAQIDMLNLSWWNYHPFHDVRCSFLHLKPNVQSWQHIVDET